MRSRGVRRHHEERIRRKVRGYHGGHAAASARALGRLAGTRRPCSCWMCGNPRKYRGEETLQERRAAVALSHNSRAWLE